MAANSFQYDIFVNATEAIAQTVKFAKATQKAIDKTVKKNGKLDRSLVVQRKELATARREFAKYSEGKHKDAQAADAAAHKHKQLTKEIGKTTDKIRKGKRAITEHRKALEQLQRTANKGIKIKPTSNQYPAPISPQRPGSPMMGPGGPGRRGFAGQVGNRAGFVRGAANASVRATGAFSALGGAAGSGGLLAPLASGFAVQRSVSGALDLDSQRNKLKLLSAQYGEYDKILKIIDSSADTFNKSQREATTEFANVFARLRPLGVELNQIKGVYEGFNTVAIASGATSESSRIAFMQLAQAIGSGRLAGDEFRSISEQIPGVLIPIAKELDVNVGELKKLGSEGKITSDVLINALSYGINISKEEIKAFLAEQPAQKFKAFSNSVSDLGVVVGTALLPALVPLVEKLTELVEGFIALPDPIRNVITVAGVAFLGITALAGAFKTLGLASGAKFVGNLLASAGGITAAGNASSVAAGKVGLLAAQLKGLAMLGIITVGVNYIMMGMKQGAALEDEIAKFEAGGPGAAFEGASRETVVKAQKVAKETKKQIAEELEDLTPNALLLMVPGVGAAVAGQAGSRAEQLQYRNANADTTLALDPNDFKTEAEMDAARSIKIQKAIANANKGKGKGKGRDIAGQLDKADANNALRLTQKKAQIALKVARDEYALRTELEQSNHQLQESNLVGVARQQQAIINARIQAFRGLEVREQKLKDEVTQAEQRLAAAEQRLSQATGPVDAARAAGTVSNAQADLSGAQQKLGNFQRAAPMVADNMTQAMSAQSTESFRQQTQQTLIQVGALRKRNELLAQGVSPEVLQGEMAKFEIDRQAAVQLQQLNVDQNLSADAIARVTLEAQNAKDAIDQLTAAQMEGTSALDSYVATAMAYVTDTRARITDMLSAVDGALANSIEGVINGTMTIQESFHSFFKSIGQAFLKMAAQIIAKLIIIKLLKTALGLFGSGGGGVGGNSAEDINLGSGLPSAQSAAIAGGGAVEWNSDMSTIGGNILEKFARGGIVTGPTAALIGEGGMNEAVVPLPNGKAIPVDMKGASGSGDVTSNVTVNVSNDGSSSDSDPNGPAKLGKAIDTAVRKVIMDERRSGGLLSQMYTGR